VPERIAVTPSYLLWSMGDKLLDRLNLKFFYVGLRESLRYSVFIKNFVIKEND